jgi:hypothetical protein
MTDDDEAGKDRIYVDDSLPATLCYYGRTVSWATLHEAINAWRKLPDDVRTDATIKVGGGVWQSLPNIRNCATIRAPRADDLR